MPYDWPQFDFDPQHSGNDTSESQISADNVISLHELFQAPLPNPADSSPAYLYHAATISGTRDVVFVTLMDGQIVALIASVLGSNADAVTQYRAGKAATFGFLVGQVMKAAGGKANPKRVNELLKRALAS